MTRPPLYRQLLAAVGALAVIVLLVVALVIVAWLRINDALDQVAQDRQQVRTVQRVVHTVQQDILEVPCLKPNMACRNFLSLLIANATKRQIRKLEREAHQLRRHPTSAIVRGAKTVARHRTVVHRRARPVSGHVSQLRSTPPAPLPRSRPHRPQRRGGESHSNGPPPGHGNGLPGRSAAR